MIQKDLTGNLKFEMLVPENQGLYECIVENELGQDKKGVQILLPNFTTQIMQTKNTNKANKEFENHWIRKNTKIAAKTHSVVIKVLSDPKIDHVENGKVILKCISGIDEKKFDCLNLKLI